jgi:hypothetical protein
MLKSFDDIEKNVAITGHERDRSLRDIGSIVRTALDFIEAHFAGCSPQSSVLAREVYRGLEMVLSRIEMKIINKHSGDTRQVRHYESNFRDAAISDLLLF